MHDQVAKQRQPPLGVTLCGRNVSQIDNKPEGITIVHRLRGGRILNEYNEVDPLPRRVRDRRGILHHPAPEAGVQAVRLEAAEEGQGRIDSEEKYSV